MDCRASIADFRRSISMWLTLCTSLPITAVVFCLPLVLFTIWPLRTGSGVGLNVRHRCLSWRSGCTTCFAYACAYMLAIVSRPHVYCAYWGEFLHSVAYKRMVVETRVIPTRPFLNKEEPRSQVTGNYSLCRLHIR